MNTKGVEDGMSDEKVVCGNCGSEPHQWCGRGVGRGQVTAISTACFEPKTAAVPVAILSAPAQPSAAVPVEERTATKQCQSIREDGGWYCQKQDGHEGPHQGGYMMEIFWPIPEERTAEMEQLMELLREVPLNLYHQGLDPKNISAPHPDWCAGCKLQKRILDHMRQLLIDGGMLTLDEPYEYDFDPEGR